MQAKQPADITMAILEECNMEEGSDGMKFMGAKVGLSSLGVTCSPRDPRFAGSNPAEFDGFFQDVKILSTSPLGGTSS